MEFCKNCGEVLNKDGTCPACVARMARERQQTEEPSAEAPKRTQAKPVQTKKRKPQNSLRREQNSLGDDRPKQKSKPLLWIGIAAGLVVIVCALLLFPLPEIKDNTANDPAEDPIVEFVAEDYDQTGTCGEDVQWGYKEETGELVIIGTGAMENYEYDASTEKTTTPWSELPIKAVHIYGVTTLGADAFSYCTGLTSVDIPDSVTTIGDYAFFDCDGLTSVEIPDSVTTIGEGAFQGCDGLTSVDIPDSVTTIGYGVFYECDSLTSVKIPDSVTSIGAWAFSGCESLTEITIPDSVTTIGYAAFYDCTGLVSVELPGSMATIRDELFAGCPNLTDVYYTGTQE